MTPEGWCLCPRTPSDLQYKSRTARAGWSGTPSLRTPPYCGRLLRRSPPTKGPGLGREGVWPLHVYPVFDALTPRVKSESPQPTSTRRSASCPQQYADGTDERPGTFEKVGRGGWGRGGGRGATSEHNDVSAPNTALRWDTRQTRTNCCSSWHRDPAHRKRSERQRSSSCIVCQVSGHLHRKSPPATATTGATNPCGG